MKYQSIFELLAEEFQKAKIPVLLIGGFAVNYYNVPRVTMDINLLMADQDFEPASLILKQAVYEQVVQGRLFARFRSADPTLMDLDTVFVDKKTMDGILKEATESEIEGRRFKVPSINHLIALKLHSVKNNPRAREFRDLGDIVELVKQHHIDVRSENFKQLCLKYGTEEIYQKILGSQKQ